MVFDMDYMDEFKRMIKNKNNKKIEVDSNNVLFVCNSNLFVSKAAEIIFNHYSTDRKAFSGGLGGFTGTEDTSALSRVCKDYGIKCSEKSQITNIHEFSLEDFGLVLASSNQVKYILKMLNPNMDIFTIKEYCGCRHDMDILEPYEDDYFGNYVNHAEIFREIHEWVLKIAAGDEIEIVDDDITVEKDDISEGQVTGGNFKCLDGLIHSGAKRIVLSSDIVLDENEIDEYCKGIRLDIDGLTIDGNGHCIDARGNARIFYNLADNVTIKNITLKNGYCEEGGSAIYNRYGHLRLIESSLINNKSDRTGSALTNWSECTIIKSHFIKNHGYEAICNVGVLIVVESEFAYNERRVIENDEGSISISKSTFDNNSSPAGPCAIHNFVGGLMHITKSKLSNNNTKISGAFQNDYYAYISECIFSKNSSASGGAFGNYGSLLITDSILDKNVSKESGGAVKNGENMVAVRCEFNENSSDYGGAIFSNYGIAVFESEFKGNTAKREGGALFNEGDNLNIVKSNFHKNDSEFGGGIYNNRRLDIAIEESLFEDNMAKWGGAIFNDKESKLKISASTFKNNHARRFGGAVHNDGDYSHVGNLVVEYSTFADNRAESGGALSSYGILNLTGCDFISNAAKSVGGAINYSTVAGVPSRMSKIAGCNFKYNKPEDFIRVRENFYW